MSFLISLLSSVCVSLLEKLGTLFGSWVKSEVSGEEAESKANAAATAVSQDAAAGNPTKEATDEQSLLNS
jgi:hypothetical protein